MRRNLLPTILLLLLPLAFSALPRYRSLETPNFRVYFRNGWESEAERVLQTMEFYRPYVEELTGYPVGQTAMVIEDMGNEVNGYMNLLGDKIALFAYPPTADELSNGEEWWQLVAVHEYIHRTQMSSATGLPSILRKALGNIFYPSIHQPNWVTEGITVYGESQLSPYTGRMRGGYYSNVITALAKEGRLPDPAKANVYSKDTPLAHYYVFGGSFFSYLAETYGEERFSRYFARQGADPISYLGTIFPALATGDFFEEVYETPLDSLWNNWILYEQNRSISLPTERITRRGWNYNDLQSSDGALYYSHYQRDATGPFTQFGQYTIQRITDPTGTAQEETIHRQATDFPASFQVKGDKLYFSRSEYQRGFDNNEELGWGSITELWIKDLITGTAKKLLEGSIRSFLVLDNGNILVARDEANYRINTLRLYSPDGEPLTESWRVEALIAKMVEHEGSIYATAKESWQNSGVYELHLSKQEILPLINTPFAEKLVGISGGLLIFDASYGDRMNSYGYRFSNGDIYRLSDLSGLRSTQIWDTETLYTIGMNAGGEDIYKAELRLTPFSLPTDTAAEIPPELTYLDDTAQIMNRFPARKGSYLSNLSHWIFPRIARIPFVDGTGDSLVIGAILMGQDLVGDLPSWDARLQYDTRRAKFGISLNLTSNLLSPLEQDLSYSSFDGGSLRLDNRFNLLRRKNYGLNSMWSGLAFAASSGYDRQIWEAYVSTSWSWPGGRLGLSNSILMERKDFLPSDRDRIGWQGRLSIAQQTGQSSMIKAQLHCAYDPDADTDEVFSSIRSFDTEWQQNRGLNLMTTFNFPIAKIRKGLWTPQIYAEDLFAGVFFDASLPFTEDFDDTRYSAGLELVSELTMFSVVSLDFGLRLGLNSYRKIVPGLILGSSF